VKDYIRDYEQFKSMQYDTSFSGRAK